MSNPNFVYMRHPVLSSERICISRSALQRYRKDGWQIDDHQWGHKDAKQEESAELPKKRGRPSASAV